MIPMNKDAAESASTKSQGSSWANKGDKYDTPMNFITSDNNNFENNNQDKNEKLFIRKPSASCYRNYVFVESSGERIGFVEKRQGTVDGGGAWVRDKLKMFLKRLGLLK